MTPDSAKGPYSAAAIPDRNLNTTIIALSYTDPNDPTRNLLACIAPHLGSNFYRFKVGVHELFHCEEEKLKEHDHTGNLVLWPFPNRVRDKQYTYHSRQYSLGNIKHGPGSLVHGLVYDRAWVYEQPSANAEEAMLTTAIEIKPDSPNYGAYPFPSKLKLTYRLTASGVTVTYTVQNKGSEPLPYGFALHPYLNLLPDRQATLVTLPANRVMEADQELLPTGRLLNVRTTMYEMFDLNQPTPVHQLKLDHVYTNLAPIASSVEYPGLGLKLHLSASPDFTHTVIYTPTRSPYFCLENQTCATDAINLANNGMQEIAHLLEVQPGEETTGFIYYKVEHV